MNLDYLSHALHVSRPLSHVQFPHLAAAAPSPSAKGHLKVLRISNLKLFFVVDFLNVVKIGLEEG